VYVASKHAEIGLTKSAALDYADRGVRVNAVCPGLVNTPLIADMITENPELHGHLVASHPLGRIAEPEEVADAIVRLATTSPATSPASPCRSTAATSPADPPRHRSPRTQGAPTHDAADERTSIHGHHRR
jgi:NAD(P)-dependent dehydrogenase (short-subunit alcohol dehydrogenase family)